MLRIGTAMVNITPPLGLEMAGYGVYINRLGKEIHDDLFARAVLFDDGSNGVLLVVCDLCGIGRHLVMHCRREISGAVGIPEENIAILSTHTHSGPVTVYLRGWGEMDENYLGSLKEKLVEAAKEADKDLEPVMVGAGQGRAEINFNRVVKDGPTDTALMVLRADDLNGKTKVLLYNYSAHAVVMGSGSFAVSADWPGYANAKVEDVLDGGMTVFLQGFCGDVNVKDACSSSFDKAREHGEVAADEVLRVAKAIKVKKEGKIKMYSKIVGLPLEIPDEKGIEAVIQRYAEHRKQVNWERFFREWKTDTLREINRNPRDLLPAEIQAIAIGNDILFVTLPGEIFTKWGMQIKKISPFKHTFVAGYANDFVGYIPDEDDFAKKGYAADMVPVICGFFHFRPDVGQVLVDKVSELIQKLSSKKSTFDSYST